MKAIKFLWECIGNFLGPSMSAWKGWIVFFEILIAIAICVIVCIFVNLEYAFFITVGIILGICAVSGKTFWGETIGKIISVQFLSNAGRFIGGFIGGIAGGVLIDVLSNQIFNEEQNILESLKENFFGEIFSRLINQLF